MKIELSPNEKTTKPKVNPFKVTNLLSASSGKFRSMFWDYAPKIFDEIRKMDGIDQTDYYVRSTLPFNGSRDYHIFLLQASFEPIRILKGTEAKESGGRSGSFFIITPNNKYLIKTITVSESRLLRKIIPLYYEVHPSCYCLAFADNQESIYWAIRTRCCQEFTAAMRYELVLAFQKPILWLWGIFLKLRRSSMSGMILRYAAFFTTGADSRAGLLGEPLS